MDIECQYENGIMITKIPNSSKEIKVDFNGDYVLSEDGKTVVQVITIKIEDKGSQIKLSKTDIMKIIRSTLF